MMAEAAQGSPAPFVHTSIRAGQRIRCQTCMRWPHEACQHYSHPRSAQTTGCAAGVKGAKGAGRTVALDEVEAPAVEADAAAQPLHPGLDVVLDPLLAVVDVGGGRVVLPLLLGPCAPKGGVVAANRLRAPG